MGGRGVGVRQDAGRETLAGSAAEPLGGCRLDRTVCRQRWRLCSGRATWTTNATKGGYKTKNGAATPQAQFRARQLKNLNANSNQQFKTETIPRPHWTPRCTHGVCDGASPLGIPFGMYCGVLPSHELLPSARITGDSDWYGVGTCGTADRGRVRGGSTPLCVWRRRPGLSFPAGQAPLIGTLGVGYATQSIVREGAPALALGQLPPIPGRTKPRQLNKLSNLNLRSNAPKPRVPRP